MPSRLRIQTSFEDTQALHTIERPTASPPQKKQKMSLSQTYFIAASARTKLGKEACKPDHNLRLLVGHANLLDSLMVDLHDAEREQEAWFNATVQKAQKADEQRHIQWLDNIAENDDDEDMDDAASDVSDSDSDDDEEDYDFASLPRRLRAAPVSITTQEVDEDEEFSDEEDDLEHALVRTASGTSPQSPPELVEDSDSDDESAPASPPSAAMEFTDAQRHAIATTAFFDAKPVVAEEEVDFAEAGYYLPARIQAPLIAAC